MCDIGRIKHHLKHNLWNPNNTILFVGYQAPGTLGRTIVDGAEKVKIFGEEISINARIEYIEGYSGHADQEWLLNFVYSFIQKPKHIFLVHGEPEGQEVLKEKIIKNANIPVTIPKFGEKYSIRDIPLLEDRIEISKKLETKQLRTDILSEIDKLRDEVQDATNTNKIKDYSREESEKEISELTSRVEDLKEMIKKILEK